jgi:uncharacterized protein YqjF (DUF2071 family)
MLNFEVPPELLFSHVPKGTVLDQYQSRTLVSIVGFLFRQTRVKGMAIPFHVNFEEVNLRFYVRREEAGQIKRGVVFIKEIVPRMAIAWVARRLYNEPYEAMAMRHKVDFGSHAQYAWRFAGRWNSMEITTQGEPFLPSTGSEEEFISEHYWGYTAQKDGSTLEYEVKHPKWKVWKAGNAVLDCDVATLYGNHFHPYIQGEPSSAFLAEGSPVSVHEGRPLALLLQR